MPELPEVETTRRGIAPGCRGEKSGEGGCKAGNTAPPRFRRLVEALRAVLSEAIDQGGTTLRDFKGGEGKPGYFALSLDVYGRGGEPCRKCGAGIQTIRQGGRSTYFCGKCQR